MKLLLIPLVLLPVPLLAEYSYGTFDGTVYTYDQTALYESADLLSEQVVKLPPGREITIEENTEISILSNNLEFDWYKVSCTVEGTLYEGYSPSYLFACSSELLDDGSRFLYAVQGNDPETWKLKAEAKLVYHDETLFSTPVEPQGDMWGDGSRYTYSINSSFADPSQFTGVESIILLDFSYEACGYLNRITPLFISNQRIIPGPIAISVSEAGLFRSTTEILTPANSAAPENTLILRLVAAECDELGNETSVEVTETEYLWTGDEFTER